MASEMTAIAETVSTIAPTMWGVQYLELTMTKREWRVLFIPSWSEDDARTYAAKQSVARVVKLEGA